MFEVTHRNQHGAITRTQRVTLAQLTDILKNLQFLETLTVSLVDEDLEKLISRGKVPAGGGAASVALH